MLKQISLVLSLTACAIAQAQAVRVDPKLPAYKKVSGVSGNLNSVGSDTLNNLMAYWAEGFSKKYPGVKIQVEGKGSATAPPALIEGTSQLGPMSREMKNDEIDKFEKKYGYKPTRIAVAIDTLAVFVHKQNPVKSLSLEQVDAIFSRNRKGGHEEIKTWGQLGVGGDLAARPISLYGRNSASGTYGYFKDHALFKGDFKDTVKEQPGSSSVVQGVGNDKTAIGYSGIGYATSNVRALPLVGAKKANGGEAFPPTYENAISGKYPLSRMLYIYINQNPKKPMDPLVKEFLTFALSKEGQEIVVKDGYLPMTPKLEEAERTKLK